MEHIIEVKFKSSTKELPKPFGNYQLNSCPLCGGAILQANIKQATKLPTSRTNLIGTPI